jgi:hypothetical protein
MADIIWPSDQLRPPDLDEIDKKIGTLNDTVGFSQYISPAYYLGNFLEWLLEKNPWEFFSEAFAGDWKSVAETAVALKSLANYSTAYADALRAQTGPLFTRYWTGNAATHANDYFTRLEQTMRGQVQPLQDLSGQVWRLAIAVNQMADLIKGLIEELVDLAITLGFGNLAKGAGAAVEASKYAKYYAILQRIWAKWNEILELYDKGVDRTRVILSLILGYTATLRGMTLPALAQTAYDNPKV